MSNSVVEINGCEVCGNTELEEVLDLGLHPLCDDLVEVTSDRICVEYPIKIGLCNDCKTAHQLYQVPKAELFPESYHYRARFTADVLNGMRSLVESCESKVGTLEGKTVLDVGCNDGSLLNFFREKGAETIGIEPTLACRDAEAGGHVVFHDYFAIDSAEKIKSRSPKIDVITFTNVFAHIEDLEELLSALKLLVSDETVIIIENHYLSPVLEKNQFDTFYHEHPRTYSLSSFIKIADNLGMVLMDVEFPERYGGNIRVTIGSQSSARALDLGKVSQIRDGETTLGGKFSVMRENIAAWKKNKKSEISQLVAKYGKLKGKAFPGRAAILIRLLDLDDSHISAVYEKPGSLKIGHYIPGTRIPILSDDELFSSDDLDSPLINFAWHISHEIRSYLQNAGYRGDIIDILHPDDYS